MSDDSPDIRYHPQTTYYQQLSGQAIEQLEAGVSTEWQVGDVILDLYEITGLLGEGGMGKVYRAHHRGWNIDLAVKCPKAETFTSQKGKELFIQEAETWVKLGLHPHIAACYYVRTLGGVPRIFAECVEGGSLESWIESGRLYEGGKEQALECMLDIAIQFAWGLGYAHGQGLVHQDVKPHNVLMTPEVAAKVTDFGLAKARGPAGTPAYQSPEQARGEELTLATDIWSWAVSVLEMYTGGVTWMSGLAAGAVLENYVESGGTEGRVPGMPPGLVELLVRCFHVEPGERPADMRNIARAVQELYKQLTGKSYLRREPQTSILQADSLNNQALSLYDLGRIGDARDLWQGILKINPGHLETTYNLGLVQWRAAQKDDAGLLRDLEAAAVSSEHWRRDWLTAQVHLERGDVEQAQMMLEKLPMDVAGRTDIAAVRRQSGTLANSAHRLRHTLSGVDHWRLCLSEDGNLALAANTGIDVYSLKLWDVKSGGCLRTFDKPIPGIFSVSMSADQHFALTVTRDKTFQLWDLIAGQCLRTNVGDKDKSPVCLSRDGKNLLMGGKNRTLRLCDAATGNCLRTFTGHTGRISAVYLSWDGRLALSGSTDRTVKLWDMKTGQCIRTFEGHSTEVSTVWLSRNGLYLLSEGTYGDTSKIWDAATGECLLTLDKKANPESIVCLSTDKMHALSMGDDKLLKLWELATGKLLRTFEGHTDRIYSISLREDGRFALSGSYDGALKLWDAMTGRCLRTFEGHKNCVIPVLFSEDGQTALSGSWDRTLKVWDMATEYSYKVPFAVSRIVTSETSTTIESLLLEAQNAHRAGNVAAEVNALRRARSIPGYEQHNVVREAWSRLYLKMKRVSLRAGWLVGTLESHTNSVLCACLSPNGRHALSGSADNTLKLWDVGIGGCVRTYEGHSGAVRSAYLSADGRYALSGSADKTIKLWNVATGQCLRTLTGHRDSVLTVCLSEDGRRAFSGSSDYSIRIWDVVTGVCVRTLTGHNYFVKSLCLSPDEQYLLSGGSDYTVKLWEVASGQCLRTLTGHTSYVESACLSADGLYALSGSADKTLRLWDVVTGKCLQILEGHTDWVNSVCLSADGHFALSGSNDKTIKLWELATGKCLYTLSGLPYGINAVNLSGDGRFMLSVGADKGFKLWELDWELEETIPADWHEGAQPYLDNFIARHLPYGGEIPRDHSPTDEEIILAFTRRGVPSWNDHDQRQLLYQLGCAGYGWLKPEGVLRELAKQAEIMKQNQSMEQENAKALIRTAGEAMAAGQYTKAGAALRKAITLQGYERDEKLLANWHQCGLRSGRRVGLLSEIHLHSLEGHVAGVNSVYISMEGSHALSGSTDKTLRLWEVKSGRCLSTFEGNTKSVLTACLSADRRYVLSSGEDKTLRLWEAESGRCLRTFEGHTDIVRSVCLSVDSRLALSGSFDQTLKLWEVATGECLRTFEGHTARVTAVCISEGGRHALSGSWDKTLKLWDLASGRCLRTFEGHTDIVRSVCLGADGCYAISGSFDKTLKLWEMESGQCVRTYQGHSDRVTSVSLSADGCYAFSGGADGMIKMWDLAGGSCLHTFGGHKAGVTSVCLSGDGSYVLSGSGDKTLRLWALDWDYKFPDPAIWDEGARVYLQTFLALHPSIRGGLFQKPKPGWQEADFQQLMVELGYRGYGWLRPEGVRRKLEELAKTGS